MHMNALQTLRVLDGQSASTAVAAATAAAAAIAEQSAW
jgi:predicted ATP-dependent protease